MRSRCVVAVMVWMSVAASAQTRDENWTACRTGVGDAQLQACARLFGDSGLTAQQKAEAYNLQVIGLERKGELLAAIVDYGAAILSDPKMESAYTNRGGAYLQQGQFDRAIADAQVALTMDPNDVFALTVAGSAYRGRKEEETAKSYLRRATQATAKTQDDYLERGVAHARLEEVDAAIADFTVAIQMSKGAATARTDSLAYSNRGLQYRTQGKMEKAVADFHASIAADGSYFLPHRNLCIADVRLADFGNAEAECAVALKLQPNDDGTLSELGFLRYQQGDYDAALDAAQRAVKANPTHDDESFNLGMYEYMKGNYSQAAEQFRVTLEKNPKYLYAAMWLWMTEQRPGGRDGPGKHSWEYKEVFGIQDWPAPAFRMMTGIGTEDQVSDEVWKEGSDENRLGRFCEVYFYAGESALANGLNDVAKSDFEFARNICPRSFVEYGGAVGELKRMEAPRRPARRPSVKRVAPAKAQ